jgi:hypothetical protein
MEIMIWNAVLTMLLGLTMFVAKEKSIELSRVSILLNRTREEVAREHITRSEVRADMERLLLHVDARFNRIEVKLDQLVEKP